MKTDRFTAVVEMTGGMAVGVTVETAVGAIFGAAPSRRPSSGLAQWAITGSPSDGARARFGIRSAESAAPTTKMPAPHARVAV